MTHEENFNLLEELLQILKANDSGKLLKVLTLVLNESMKLERTQALQAKPFERSKERKGWANGFKDKTVATGLGKMTVKIPQVRNGEPFYPSALEKGIRSERALKLAIAEMYLKGVSTRKVSKITEALCGTEISSTQVSRVTQSLDEEFEKWRNESIGEIQYLYLDAKYEHVRVNGSVVSMALLVAVGVDYQGKRQVLGCSVSTSEAEVHWRNFLGKLIQRGLNGVKLIISDDHTGLKAARKASFNAVPWQRCQFHLQQNAQAYVNKKSMKKEVAEDIKTVLNAPDKPEAERYLKKIVEKYEKSNPKLSEWMENNIPESLTVFDFPKKHQRKIRTSNMIERVMKEINRRTKIVGIFPNEDSLLRLASAVLMERNDTWISAKIYLGDPNDQ
jgi:putative transposase